MPIGDHTNTAKPKLELIRTNPAAAAAISKAVRSHLQTGFNVNKKETYYGLNQSKFKSISDTQRVRLNENENILDLFPDILLAEQIIVSSILSPKDMFTGNLIYQTKDIIIPSTVQMKINDVIKSHLETYYDIKTELPCILRDALFRTGSYVSAVLPEAAVDEIINGRNYATESHKSLINELISSAGHSRSIGILGPPTKQQEISALESFFNSETPRSNHSNFVTLSNGSKEKMFIDGATTEKFLEITDNYQVIKLPRLLKAIANQRIKRAIRNPIYTRASGSISTEGYVPNGDNAQKKKLTTSEFMDLVYKSKPPNNEVFSIFPTKDHQKRHSIGRPLRIRIPSESVIPVYPPGDPSNHRGYFVMVDIDGNWVTRSTVDLSNNGLQSLLANQGISNNLNSLMLQKANKSLSDPQNDTVIDNMLEIYSSIVENDMVNRLRNGVYGTQMEVCKDKEWDRIMLARALSGKMTRMVYFPKELVTYYAFDYHKNGVGKSYLDQVKLLTSLRAVLLFSKVMAQLKNAINVTKVDMTLDAEDQDPIKTIEIATHDIMRLRESYFPLGVNSPVDLVQWIQRAGLMFTFKGHAGLPETSFEFSTSNMQHQLPDQATSDDLRKQTFMTMGLTPEQVDEGFSAQFATTIINQNAMFAKRISMLSDATSLHLTEDVKNIVINDTIILQEIMKILKESGDDVLKYLKEEEKELYEKNPDKFILAFLDKIVDNILVNLPKPNVASNAVQAEDFNNYSDILDKVLNSIVSDEVFAGPFAGEFSSHANEIKAFWKHFLLRKWITDEGFLPDISEIFKKDENGQPTNDILDVMDSYTRDVMSSAVKLIKKLKTSGSATDKDLTNLNVGEGSGSSFGSTDENTGTEEESEEDTSLFDLETPEGTTETETEETEEPGEEKEEPKPPEEPEEPSEKVE